MKKNFHPKGKSIEIYDSNGQFVTNINIFSDKVAMKQMYLNRDMHNHTAWQRSRSTQSGREVEKFNSRFGDIEF